MKRGSGLRGLSLMLHRPYAGEISPLGVSDVICSRRCSRRISLLRFPLAKNLGQCSLHNRAFCKTIERSSSLPQHTSLSKEELWSGKLEAFDDVLKTWTISRINSEFRRARNYQARAASSTMAGLASGGPPEGYQPNVGVCVVNAKDEVFVASRLDIPDSWQMPQGGVDDNEEPRNASLRELKEETGLSSVELIGEVQEWLTYDFPPDVKAKITRLWGREWLGQAQKWFLYRFHGDESEVNLNGDGSEQPEFGHWKWASAEEVLRKVVEFKRPVYAQAFRALAVHIEAWAKL